MPLVELVHRTTDAEKLIVRMARVSNKTNESNWETGPKLLRYLIEHRHWSPFEMVSMCVQIETERDIAAQILRHRSFSFQEFSTRYAETFRPEIPTLRTQDEKNRQASHDNLDPDLARFYERTIGVSFSNLYLLYQEMLAAGVARETARRILPLCTPTTLYMHGTLRSWIHYLDVRCEAGTQLEHRQVAEQVRKIFCREFPITADALGWS